ncbi:MAG: ribonuclease III [Pseudomonadota bacterium]
MSERRTALVARLQAQLGYQFEQQAILDRALNHRSARGVSNERLEFLGDALLDAVISDCLFHQFPDADEGVLSRLRASLVRDESLAAIAGVLSIGSLLRLGPGELKSGGARRGSLHADALEALFAAVFLDGGYKAADDVIRRVFADRLANLEITAARKDAKTRLQELLQAQGHPLPDYALVKTDGPQHKQRFFVTCAIDEPRSIVCDGVGHSRRIAEQNAADAVWQALTNEEAPA